jgi:hypothetical protein
MNDIRDFVPIIVLVVGIIGIPYVFYLIAVDKRLNKQKVVVKRKWTK